MTNTEIAKRLREILKEAGIGDYETLLKFQRLADELDPPKPEPGTVVWWRITMQPDSGPWIGWHAGIVTPTGDIVRGDGQRLIGDYEWEPARILAPDEVAVKVPPVSEWRGQCYYAAWMDAGEALDPTVIITFAEAEEMEAER